MSAYLPNLLSYMPHVWFIICVLITLELLYLPAIQDQLKNVYSKLEGKRRVISYVVAALFGAGLFSFYWWGIGKTFTLLEKQKADIPPPVSQQTDKTQLEPKPLPAKETPPPHKDKAPHVDAKAQEIQRRYEVLTRLRDEYVLTRTGVSAGLLERKEYPPPEWINQRLRELGETWRFEDKDKMYRLSKYEAMTNQELHDETLKFVAEIRTFNNQKVLEDRVASDRLWSERVNAPTKEKQLELWQKEQTESTARRARTQAEYNDKFRGSALSLCNELRKRVPELAKTLGIGPKKPILFDYGSFAGPDAIGNAADYLDQMARGLPVK